MQTSPPMLRMCAQRSDCEQPSQPMQEPWSLALSNHQLRLLGVRNSPCLSLPHARAEFTQELSAVMLAIHSWHHREQSLARLIRTARAGALLELAIEIQGSYPDSRTALALQAGDPALLRLPASISLD